MGDVGSGVISESRQDFNNKAQVFEMRQRVGDAAVLADLERAGVEFKRRGRQRRLS